MQLQVLAPTDELSIGEDSSSEQLIEWTLQRFAHQRMVITTGFGMEGCALIEMYAAYGKPLDVIYLDTMFFFPETYSLIEKLRSRHPHLNFINQGTTLTPEEQEVQYGRELWKRNPDLCCQLRKVDPMRETLRDVDIWITGVRRSQAPSRAGVQVVEWNWKYQVLKISPLARWSRKSIREFVESNHVPYNELHDKGYPSVGCTHCTRAVPGLSAEGYSREGRWAGTEKTECGLHT